MPPFRHFIFHAILLIRRHFAMPFSFHFTPPFRYAFAASPPPFFTDFAILLMPWLR